VALVGASAFAQQRDRLYRVGYLANSDAEAGYFRSAMQSLSYGEGQNLLIEWRFSQGRLDRLAMLATELVNLKPDCVVAVGINPTRAVQQATAAIPVVMANADDDPVRHGLVASYARPGGNITGVISIGWVLAGKRLELARDLVPGLSRVAVLSQPSSRASAGHLRETEAAAAALGITLDRLEFEDVAGLEAAMRIARERGSQVIIVPPVGLMGNNAQRIVDIAAELNIPVVSDSRFAAAGALAGYSDDAHDRYRHVARYVDRILKGEKPADLPVQQPTKFELVINLKTAKILGLAVPPALLARADEVIE